MNGMINFRAVLLASLTSCFFIGCDINFTMMDGYSFNYSGSKAEKTETGSIADGIQQIDVENKFGDIKVTLATDDQPGWIWNAQVWADSDEMSELMLEDTFLEIETIEDTQVWKLVLPESKSDLNGVTSNLVFRVPAGMRVNLINRHGNLDLSKIDGKVDADNRHGDVTLMNLSGMSSIKNAHGDLTAESVSDANLTVNHGNTKISSAEGKIQFDGSHGYLVAEDIEGELEIDANHMGVEVSRVAENVNISVTHNDVKVVGVAGDAGFQVQHGDITAKELVGNVSVRNTHGDTLISTTGESVEVRAQHGGIRIEIENPDFSSVSAETSHDDIDLRLPESVKPSIKTSASHGDLESEFESDPDSSQNVTLKTQHGDINIKSLGAKSRSAD